MSKNNDHSKAPHHKNENPLEKIKEKELELGGRYLETKKRTEIIISEARKKADEIKRGAKENAIKEAELYYEQKLSLLNKDKNKSDDSGVANIEKLAGKNFNNTYEYLLKQIAPGV
ncbi:MAG: hypothetical protein ABII25_08635 [bacterium]